MSASGSITITPGITLAANDSITHTELNLLGKPAAQLDPDSVGAEHIVREELVDLLGNTYNYLDNGNFAENRWSRGATATTCPAGLRTYRADQWWCRPTNGPVTYERDTAGPDTKSVHSAKITGYSGVSGTPTTVEFGQDIPRRISSALKGKLVLSFYFYNGTGAAFTPTVLLNTCNGTADDFDSVSNHLSSTPADTAGNGAWTKYEVALDCSALTDIAKGLQVVIRTPGGTLTDAAKWVRLSQCKLELLDALPATEFFVEREPSEAEAAAAAAGFQPNLWINGGFAGDRFLYPGASGPTLSAGVRTPNAEGWWANPAGAGTMTYLRDTVVPNTAVGYSAKLTGGAGTNAVQFGQNLDPSRSAGLRGDVVLSLYLRYHDGAGGTMAPTLKVDTCDSYGIFGTTTNRLSAPLDGCTDDVWTRVSYQFDGSLLTNMGNGCRIYLEIPSGSLDASSKTLHIAEALLQTGTVVNTLSPYPELGQVAMIGAQRDLKIEGGGLGSADTFIGSAEMVVLQNIETGQPFVMRNLSATCDITGPNGAGRLDTGSRAANTWYFIYVIHNGTSGTFLMSASATAPVMPAGYIYRALVGAVYNAGAGGPLKKFRQVGRIVHQESPPADFVSSTGFAAIALASQVPSIARMVWGSISKRTSGNLRAQVAFDSLGSGAMPIVVPAVGAAYNGDFAAGLFRSAIDTAGPQIWVRAADASDYRITVCGFEMNLP